MPIKEPTHVSPALVKAIRSQYKLSWHGIHGPRHWARVLENGLKLAEHTGANPQIVELFAVFHDACRVNDDWDENHGGRGASLAELFRGKLFMLDDKDLITLKTACRLHTDGLIQGDITVVTCWDADRLDLGRVGMKPYKDLLCTEAARNSNIFEWANDRACNGFIPEFAKHWMNPS